MPAFTTPTENMRLNSADAFAEIAAAIAELWNCLVCTNNVPYGGFGEHEIPLSEFGASEDDIRPQSAFCFSGIQRWIRKYCVHFLDTYQYPTGFVGLDSIDGPPKFTWETLCSAAGLANGFRRVPGNSWPTDWTNYADPAYEYGFVTGCIRPVYYSHLIYGVNEVVSSGGTHWKCLIDGTINVTPTEGATWTEITGEDVPTTGDIVGPWIWADIIAMLRLLKAMLYRDSSVGGGGDWWAWNGTATTMHGIVSSVGSWAAAKAAAEADYAVTDSDFSPYCYSFGTTGYSAGILRSRQKVTVPFEGGTVAGSVTFYTSCDVHLGYSSFDQTFDDNGTGYTQTLFVLGTDSWTAADEPGVKVFDSGWMGDGVATYPLWCDEPTSGHSKWRGWTADGHVVWIVVEPDLTFS